MKIRLDTLEKMPAAVDSYGEKVSALLCLGSHLRDQPFALVSKKLFGGSGEVFTRDRYISFKSNGGFTKLKEQVSIPYSEVTVFEPSNGSTGLDWHFRSADSSFSIGLVYYGSVKGIAPRDIFWYQMKEFPPRSGAFFKLLSAVVPETGFTSSLRPSSVKRDIEDAMSLLQGNSTPEASDPYAEFTAFQAAFSRFLAGTAMANDDNTDDYLEIFRGMDTAFAAILKKLMAEYNAGMGGMFSGEQRIYDADEKFQRLSSLWYLRQMASLHFASKHLAKEDIRHWSLKVLKPRARRYSSNGRPTIEIKLPPMEDYEEALAALD